MATFEIAFDTPKFGWLPITLTLDDQSFTFDASGVLNDPVTELTVAVLKLLDGPTTEHIRFWLEPLWHLLAFRTDGLAQTEIVFSYLADEDQQNPRLVVSTTANTTSLCRLVLTRLRSMHAAAGADHYPSAECWGKEFPDDRIAKAFDRIRIQSDG